MSEIQTKKRGECDTFIFLRRERKAPRQNNWHKSEAVKPKDTLGVRSAHTLWYVSDEQRRQSGWIGRRTVPVILSRSLKEVS